MKKRVLIALLFLSVKLIFAQDFKLDAGKIVQREYLEVIDFELLHGKIIIPVIIEGQSYRFLLDTGAPNIISKRLATVFNSSKKKELDVVDVNNLNEKMDIVPIPSIHLGSLRFENGVAIVVDLDNHPILQCFKLDGFIGSNFFKDAVLQVDFPAKKIRIAHTIKSLSPISKSGSLQLIGKQMAPFIEVKHENEKGDKGSEFALLDTGMEGLYDLSDRIYTEFQKDAIIKTVAESKGVTELGLFAKTEPTPYRYVAINQMQINNTKFKGLQVLTTADANSRVGLELFQYGKITLDFHKKKWYYEAPTEINFTQSLPPITPTIIDNKLVVGVIWDTQYNNQLQFGNPITRIDEYRMENLSVCEILAIKNQIKMRTHYEIEIKNNAGETVLIKMKK
jgi:predicted aspartyl protease